MTTTDFDIYERDNQVWFVVDEYDHENSWYGCEMFHPTFYELLELHHELRVLLESKGILPA